MIKNSRKTKNSISKIETPKVETAKLESPKVETRRAEPLKTVTPTPVPVQASTRKPARISLELVRPGAKTVYVAGSFNEWKPEQTPLVQQGNGRWVGDLAVPPGRHEYLFVVDGQWIPDPKANETVQNPFGGRNSVLTVSE